MLMINFKELREKQNNSAFKNRERNAGEDNNEPIKKRTTKDKTVFVVYVRKGNGTPTQLKIGGKVVSSTNQETLTKTIATLEKKPFNKDKSFYIDVM